MLFANVRWLWVYGRVSLARLLRDSRLGPIEGGNSEILKEILSKMITTSRIIPAVKCLKCYCIFNIE
jgi:hypothetical protein